MAKKATKKKVAKKPVKNLTREERRSAAAMKRKDK